MRYLVINAPGEYLTRIFELAAILEPAETSQINFASHSQPVCTAIQIALVKLLQEWSIKPTAVVGHSSGE